MTQMDDELKRVLRRVEPPDGFTERVLARVEEGNLRPLRPSRSGFRGLVTGFAAAAVLAIAVMGGLWYRAEQRRQAQGVEARRQVLLTLRIAGSKLHEIQTKVNNQDR